MLISLLILHFLFIPCGRRQFFLLHVKYTALCRIVSCNVYALREASLLLCCVDIAE